MSQEDAQEMCSYEVLGQYRVNTTTSWEKMAEQGISYADGDPPERILRLARDWKMIGFFRLHWGKVVGELGLGLRPDLLRAGLGKETGAGGSGA